MGLITPATQFESPEESQAVQAPKVNQPSQGNKMAIASTKVVTNVVRGSYMNVFEPRAQEEGKPPKYSMTLLIPKTDTVTLNKIKAAQEAAIVAKFPNKRPAKLDTTVHDGDGVRPSTGEPFGDECKGNMVMSVSSKFKPKILDRNGNEVIDPGDAMSGDYFKVSLNFYGYDQAGKRGVSAGLGNLLLWDKGDPLGGTSRAEDDFADDLAAK